MTDYQRLTEVFNRLGKSARAVSIDLGLTSPQIFYDIKAGKCGISKDLASKIQEKYQIRAAYLLAGDGEMLSPLAQQVEGSCNNMQQAEGKDIKQSLTANALNGDTLDAFKEIVSMNAANTSKALDEIANHRKLLAEALNQNKEQFNRLISLLERQSKKAPQS